MRKNRKWIKIPSVVLALILTMLMIVSCVGGTGAPGADGEDGTDGEDGRDGRDGRDGQDGTTPHIGNNGNWWIGDVDTGVRAEGLDGEDGKDGKDGMNGSKGKDGKDGEDGEDGLTPYVGPNGNWWLGNTDTGVCAEGLDGEDGEKGDTGAPGKNGTDGKTPVFRVSGGYLQWKYEGESAWKNLYELDEPLEEGLVRVRYSLGGGTLPSGVASDVIVTPGTTIYLPTPEYDGYSFDGWYISGEEYPVTSPYRVHQSITLTAKWVPGAKVTGTKIYTMSDLAKIKNNLEGTYVLMNDIDCGGLALPPIGTDSNNAFRGLFDGQGYTISNFVASPGQYNGLFGYNAGTIRNLNVADFDLHIEQSNTNDIVYVGGLVGYNTGVVEKCSAQNGNVYVKINNTRYAALIAGESSGTIRNCYATGKVFVDQLSASGNWAWVAGIVACNRGLVEDCFVNANVSAYGLDSGIWYSPRGEAALIVSKNYAQGVVRNCVAFGAVLEGNNRRGDICASNEGGSIANCYKDVFLGLTDPTDTYATPMSKTQLSNPDFYEITLEWDPTIWNLTNINLENGRYPTLNQK